MGQSLAHRGPDDDGIWHRPQRGSAMGNRRLSIIDIAGGHQPFVSDDGQVAVVQNGEIFNYVELAAELRAQGVPAQDRRPTPRSSCACTSAKASHSSASSTACSPLPLTMRQDAMYLVRDRIGVKPLYVADDGSACCSPPRSRPAARLPAFADGHRPGSDPPLPHLQLHPRALDHLAGRAPCDARHLAAVRRASGVQTRRWWNLADQRVEQDYGLSDWAEQFMALLDDAVRIRLRADVPWGAFLSGGVDSSSIVG
jgi:asparagine synthase (glutamine-hydrolysing)